MENVDVKDRYESGSTECEIPIFIGTGDDVSIKEWIITMKVFGIQRKSEF